MSDKSGLYDFFSPQVTSCLSFSFRQVPLFGLYVYMCLRNDLLLLLFFYLLLMKDARGANGAVVDEYGRRASDDAVLNIYQCNKKEMTVCSMAIQ